MIYLDYAATTPLHPEVISEMVEYLQNEYGNPSSKYYPQASAANEKLKLSRKDVADLLNTDPEYILFTSGATESNNFVLKGVFNKYHNRGNHIITTKIEHKAILETCKYLEKHGARVTYLDIDSEGHINLEELKNSITDETILVSVMWGNNEIGVLNEIEQIGEICHDSNVLFHTDATQVVGKIEINLKKSKIDFLSFSAHKLHGPKGIGAVYIGPDELGLRRRITPLVHGGDQEYKMRAGTHSMHNIAGFGKACQVAKRDLNKNIQVIKKLEKELKTQLLALRPDIQFNGDQSKKIPGLISVSIPGINNELFCKKIADEVAISTGSACSIGEKSYVLELINKELATSTIRLTLGPDLNDVSTVITVMKQYLVTNSNLKRKSAD